MILYVRSSKKHITSSLAPYTFFIELKMLYVCFLSIWVRNCDEKNIAVVLSVTPPAFQLLEFCISKWYEIWYANIFPGWLQTWESGEDLFFSAAYRFNFFVTFVWASLHKCISGMARDMLKLISKFSEGHSTPPFTIFGGK